MTTSGKRWILCDVQDKQIQIKLRAGLKARVASGTHVVNSKQLTYGLNQGSEDQIISNKATPPVHEIVKPPALGVFNVQRKKRFFR